MNPDPYGDFDLADDEPVADRPPGKPARPYGVRPTPPGLVRDPAVPMAEAARAPAVRPSRAPDAPAVAPSPTAPPPALPAATDAAPQAKPLRPRQERFCQLYAVIGNASDAAWQAGYTFADSRNRGYRLLRRPEIQARVAELQRDLARAIRFDAEMMLGKLEGIYRQAVQGGYYNAAARIVEIQARVAGHLRLQSAAPAPEKDPR